MAFHLTQLPESGAYWSESSHPLQQWHFIGWGRKTLKRWRGDHFGEILTWVVIAATWWSHHRNPSFFFFLKSIFVKAMPGSHITHHHYCRKRPLAGQEGDRTLGLQGVHKKGQRSWVPEWVAKTCPNSHRSPRQLASGILETAGGAGVGWVLLCKQAVPMTPTF